MSLKYGFYNSVNHDRTYNAMDFSAIFDGVISDGVFATVGKSLVTVAGSGMEVVVGNGRAWFRHTWTWLDSDLPLSVDAAHGVYDRIDTVVLEINETNRENSIYIIKGTPDSTPQSATLEEYQYPLATVYVSHGVTAITNGDILVKVGQNACPFVTGILDTISVEELSVRWEYEFKEMLDDDAAEFRAWFQHLRNELDANQAANLQRQIDETNEVIEELDTFKVGDFLNTRRTDLPNNWVLCNGETYSVSEWPELEDVFPDKFDAAVFAATNDGTMPSAQRRPGRFINHHWICPGTRWYSDSKFPMVYAAIRTDSQMDISDRNVSSDLNITTYTGLGYPSDLNTPLITYNDQTGKYIIYIPTSSYNSSHIPMFYETSDEPFNKTSGSPTWTPCLTVRPAIDGNNPLYDFVYWNGYYWATTHNGVFRCSDLSSNVWTNVFTPSIGSNFDTSTFSIVENMLVYATVRRVSSLTTEYWLDVAFVSNPSAGWTENYIDITNESRTGEFAISKIGGLYFMSGIGTSFGDSYVVLNSLTDLTHTTIPMTHATGGNRVTSICETDDAYVISCENSQTRYSRFVGVQKKVSGVPISLDDSAWMWGNIFTSGGSNSYRFEGGLYCEPGSKYGVILEKTDPTYEYLRLKAYVLNAIQVPEISLSDDFYTYCKVSEHGGEEQ